MLGELQACGLRPHKGRRREVLSPFSAMIGVYVCNIITDRPKANVQEKFRLRKRKSKGRRPKKGALRHVQQVHAVQLLQGDRFHLLLCTFFAGALHFLLPQSYTQRQFNDIFFPCFLGLTFFDGFFIEKLLA